VLLFHHLNPSAATVSQPAVVNGSTSQHSLQSHAQLTAITDCAVVVVAALPPSPW
jgi:hypothetical protein